MFERFWQQAAEHLENLEATAGRVCRIYHESMIQSGEEGLKILEALNAASHKIAQAKCTQEAILEITEDRDLAEECMDWERCLIMGFISEKVARTVSEKYNEASQKRYEYMAKRIDETLPAAGAAVLFVRQGHRIQFPQDVEVFSVSPPALDEIIRWQRDYRTAADRETEGKPADE
jgi:hypothetical protein